MLQFNALICRLIRFDLIFTSERQEARALHALLGVHTGRKAQDRSFALPTVLLGRFCG